MREYNEIRQIEESEFPLNDIYLGYNDYWEIMDRIEENNSLLWVYSEEVKELHDIINQNIQFRSNYNKDINDYL
jgi:uncharacterized protein (DUF427 family)